jgi:hypothetical protein
MTRNLPAKAKKSLAVSLYADFTENGKFETLKQTNPDNAVLSHFSHVIFLVFQVFLGSPGS